MMHIYNSDVRFFRSIDRCAILLALIFLIFSTDSTAQSVTQQVQFSHQSGYYSHPITLVLGRSGDTLPILYSTDGSEPHIEFINGKNYRFKNSYAQFPGNVSGDLIRKSFRSHFYDTELELVNRSPFPDEITQIATSFHNLPTYFPNSPVMKANVIRARYYNPDTGEHGPIRTRTFFIEDDRFLNLHLPVISLAMNNDDLFDFHKGIYVAGKILDDFVARIPTTVVNGHTVANYKQRGDEWERPANIEYFEDLGTRPVFNHQLGVRIHGGFSRSYPVKSLRLYARNEYGESHFEHKIFSQRPHDRFKRLILRNSGNDYEFTMFRDAFIHELIRDLDMESQAVNTAIVFINGEYWGIHHIRERLDNRYLERLYDIDRDRIDYLTRNREVEEGTSTHYDQMMDFIRNNSLELDENLSVVETMMDVDNYIDYIIAQTLIGNTDWPANNIDFWRAQIEYSPSLPKGKDGRWRWIFYDADFGFGLFRVLPNTNPFTYLLQPSVATHSNPLWSTELFRELNTNADFRQRFHNRYLDLLNTTFRPERIIAIADSMKSVIEPYIRDHIARWSSPKSYEDWQDEVDFMIHSYIKDRPNYVMIYLRSRYRLGQIAEITVNLPEPERGYVRLNTLNFNGQTGSFKGTYGQNAEIHLVAVPKSGYKFSHWVEFPIDEYPEAGERFSVYPEHRKSYTPVFVEATSIDDRVEMPLATRLHQNYPNPFNPITQIGYTIQESGFVKLEVFDITGRRVRVLVEEVVLAGHHTVTFDASDLSTGTYIYRLVTPNESFIRKLSLIK